MPPGPEKSRRTSTQIVEYQPGAQKGQSGGPEGAQEDNEHRNVETDAESREDSV
jgi:hypothetical protein